MSPSLAYTSEIIQLTLDVLGDWTKSCPLTDASSPTLQLVRPNTEPGSFPSQLDVYTN